MTTCQNCQLNFQATEEEQAFYQKISVPPPKLCAPCRHQRRIAFRNERSLYKRGCDLCQKSTIAMFPKDVPFPVYCQECWWSDNWDPTEYGQDFDFTKPFFPQFQELLHKVPKASLIQLNNENCEYNTFMAFSKDSYLSPGSYFVENCFYASKCQKCQDSINSKALNKCELVANSINCDNCYKCHDLIDCRNCKFSSYLSDCSSLENCFMCSGLHNNKFCFKNKKYSQEEYEKILKEYQDKSPEELAQEFQEFNKTIPKKALNQLNCENCTGDYLYNCKNAQLCFDCFDVEDSKYLFDCREIKSSMDLSMHDKDIELCYEMVSGGERNYGSKFCYCTVAAHNSEYLYSCFYLSESFACDGIHAKSQHHIFNKKYSPDQYQDLKEKIINHMQETGEYGEFLPIELSLHGYNETSAQDYRPLTKEQALAKGYKWQDKEEQTAKQPDPSNNIYACQDCQKIYRILEQELPLYKKIEVPVPKICPDCRYTKLLKLRNPLRLWQRNCDRCQKTVKTTYSPKKSDPIYCHECYLTEMY